MEVIQFVTTPDRAMRILGWLQYCLHCAPMDAVNRQQVSEIAHNLVLAISTVYSQLSPVCEMGFDPDSWRTSREALTSLAQIFVSDEDEANEENT